MRILIIGGTRFLGRALVQSAQTYGHQLTLFHRGKSAQNIFPDVEQIIGDRMADLDKLSQHTWDAVIDTCGYEPAAVRLSAEKLAGAVERYCFISTISVYADFRQIGIDETYPIARLPEGEPDSFKVENYGALKALCEQAAEDAMPGRVLQVRPGLIVGQYDPTDRFSYWPWRVAQRGDILAPGRPGYPVQFIDVRDLADWIIRMLEKSGTGIYNATGPMPPTNLGNLFESCLHAANSDARLHWIDESFLLANQVQPWSELPLWQPENDPENIGMEQVSISKAIQAGLSFRSLETTLKSTLAWVNSRPSDHTWRAGMAKEKEQDLLRKAGAI